MSGIESPRFTFNKMRSFFCDNNLDLKLRQRMQCYVWPILLYGIEVWTLKVSTMNRLEAFATWIFRRMLRISWVERVPNRDVLKRSNTQWELLNTIKCRKISYLGHIVRCSKYRLLQLILKGKIKGRRGPGRKHHSWLRNIREWTGMQNVGELFRVAENRNVFDRETRQGT